MEGIDSKSWVKGLLSEWGEYSRQERASDYTVGKVVSLDLSDNTSRSTAGATGDWSLTDERMRKVNQAVASLSEYQREAVTQRYKLNCSQLETARRMRVSESTAKRYESAAISELEKILTERLTVDL